MSYAQKRLDPTYSIGKGLHSLIHSIIETHIEMLTQIVPICPNYQGCTLFPQTYSHTYAKTHKHSHKHAHALTDEGRHAQ